MKSGSAVFLSDTAKGIAASVRESFEAFGGAGRLIKSSGDVYLKINAVDLKKYCYTDPEVIRETIRLLPVSHQDQYNSTFSEWST